MGEGSFLSHINRPVLLHLALMRRRVHKCSLRVRLGRRRCRSLAAQIDNQVCCPDWISEAWFVFLLVCGSFFSFSCFVLFFKDRVSLYIPGQSGTHYMWQASLQFEICLCLLGLKACTTMPAQRPIFLATILRSQRWTGHVKFKLSNVAVSFNHQGWKLLSHYQYPSPFESYWFLDQSFSPFFFSALNLTVDLACLQTPGVSLPAMLNSVLPKLSNSCTQELEISRNGGKVRLGWWRSYFHDVPQDGHFHLSDEISYLSF